MTRLTVISREDCGLCEEMLVALEPLAARLGATVEVIDVDGDAELRRRYGLKVPVLLLDGEQVCYGRLDEDELLRLSGARKR